MFASYHTARSAVHCHSVRCNNSRSRKPYGVYLTSAGELVLFDRSYKPMYRRDRHGFVHRDDPGRWVEGIEHKAWFFDGATSPWSNHETRQRITVILERWSSAADSRCSADPRSLVPVEWIVNVKSITKAA